MSNLAVFGALVLLGSSIPFVPTGELVSGAAAIQTDGSRAHFLAAIFAISWGCSLLGDTALFLQARYGRRHIEGLFQSRRFGGRIRRLRASVERRHVSAIILGRLIPGGRAPVLISLGASSLALRRFIATDAVACLLWSALYTATGAVASTFTGDPAWALLIAVGAALGISLVSKHLSPDPTGTDCR